MGTDGKCNITILNPPLKVDENLFLKKLMMKHSFIEKTCFMYILELPLEGNSNVYIKHMLLKIRETIWKFTLIEYHVHWLCLF